MKVLLTHLSDGHKGGGGGVALQHLFFGLRDSGIDAKVLCRTKTLDSPHVYEMPRLPKVEYPLKRLTSRVGLNDIHLVSSFGVKLMSIYREADVVDFQGMHTSTLSYMALPWLTSNKPAVFTMHDMWGITGHCTYSYDCTRWRTGCGQCPYPKTHPAIKRDATALEWQLKKWAYNRSQMAIVTGSQWLANAAKESLFGDFPIYLIPYGVDTEVFRPIDKEKCRSILGIPSKKNVLMFSALKVNDRRKGSDLLIEALRLLPESLKAETILLTFGGGESNIFEQIGMETVNLGYISDNYSKAVAYSAADLFLFPTRADVFGLVSIESQACGTPVVSFDVGGVPEHVRPELTGYLAQPEDVDDFRSGIVELLEDTRKRAQMGERCRILTDRHYSAKLRLQRYIQLYRQLHENTTVMTDGDLVRETWTQPVNQPL